MSRTTTYAAFLAAVLGFAWTNPLLAQSPAKAPPKLVVTIAVDQFSANLYAEYRSRFTGGFARLASGIVFPSGYQSHAATETCPGHSTILTGARPARTGIIANNWIDLKTKRDDKTVYCAEDETAPDTTSSKYIVSPKHFKTPTLGDRMKTVTPASRVVSVSGKDRSAVMMGGHNPDEIWWWKGSQFTSYAGRKMPAAVVEANKAAKARLEAARPPSPLPDVCKPYDHEIRLSATRSVGNGRLARKAGDTTYYTASPEADGAVLDIAAQLVKDMKLGHGPATDLLTIGMSATDYVGHYFGTEGAEMCIHLLSIDRLLGNFLDTLDHENIDYVVVLTADHGGNDVPERARTHGAPDAQRADGSLVAKKVGPMIADELKLKGQVIYGDVSGFGDYWIDPALDAAQHDAVLAKAVDFYSSQPQVEAVFTRAQILATSVPNAPPETWTLIQRVRASYDPDRSGDFFVSLKPRVTPIYSFSQPAVATHGSIWDYDRRVPILFWRKGMDGFEQPLSVETVDIMPTLAAMIGLAVPKDEIDGHCLFGC